VDEQVWTVILCWVTIAVVLLARHVVRWNSSADEEDWP